VELSISARLQGFPHFPARGVFTYTIAAMAKLVFHMVTGQVLQKQARTFEKQMHNKKFYRKTSPKYVF